MRACAECWTICSRAKSHVATLYLVGHDCWVRALVIRLGSCPGLLIQTRTTRFVHNTRYTEIHQDTKGKAIIHLWYRLKH